MKKLLILILFTLTGFHVNAQAPSQTCWVEFVDKKEVSFFQRNPQMYLSERAIARREKQHIPISYTDIPVATAYLKGIKQTGARVINKSKWFNAAYVSFDNDEALQKIKSLPYVKSVKVFNSPGQSILPSKFEKVDEATASLRINIPTNSGAAFNYGLSFNQANLIGADCMHGLGYTGSGLVIAVLDAGFFKVDSLEAFKRIRDNNQILGTRDFVVGDDSVYEDHEHGMMVLSTISGYLDGYLVGTAPDAKLWLIRTEDAPFEYIQEEVFWTFGAEFADSVGADIINSSLGYSYFDDPTSNHTYADMDGNTTIITKAADIAAAKGILVVASAGNSGGVPWFKITAPADADSVLTIGAIDSIGKITKFSGRGLTYDGRIKPDVCSKGSVVTHAGKSGGISFGGGTSFSSPITAGAVACLWQANPNRTSFELIDIIKKSANRYAIPDSVYGYGVPNFCYAHYLLNGIMSIDEYDNMQVYPNPFHNFFQITFYDATPGILEIELLDVTGKRLLAQQKNIQAYSIHTFTIDESANLAAGMYFIRVKTINKTIIKKVIKN